MFYVNLKGKAKKVGKPGVIKRAEPSPDGKFVLMETIHKPYSYLVPLYRFPTLVEIYSIDGNLIEPLEIFRLLKQSQLVETLSLKARDRLVGVRMLVQLSIM